MRASFPTADPSNYDFALVNTLVSAHYVEMFAPRVRTVLWVHEGDTVLMNSPAPVEKWRHLFSLPWKTIFQTPWQSEAVFKTLLLRVPADRVACVRNGMPTLPPDIKPAPKPPGRKRIVFVGGVYGRKRPQDLVDAVLALDRQDVECVFVGPIDNIDTIGAEHVARIHAESGEVSSCRSAGSRRRVCPWSRVQMRSACRVAMNRSRSRRWRLRPWVFRVPYRISRPTRGSGGTASTACCNLPATFVCSDGTSRRFSTTLVCAQGLPMPHMNC